MKLEEALKTGKKIRTKGSTCDFYDPKDWKYTASDVLTGEFEADEDKVTITKRQFFQAVADTLEELAVQDGFQFMTPLGKSSRPADVEGFSGWSELVKKLGF